MHVRSVKSAPTWRRAPSKTVRHMTDVSGPARVSAYCPRSMLKVALAPRDSRKAATSTHWFRTSMVSGVSSSWLDSAVSSASASASRITAGMCPTRADRCRGVLNHKSPPLPSAGNPDASSTSMVSTEPHRAAMCIDDRERQVCSSRQPSPAAAIAAAVVAASPLDAAARMGDIDAMGSDASAA